MATVRCPFCHEWIPEDVFEDHANEHQKRRADGQQESYVSLPEEARNQGSLDGVPRTYVHSACGVATEMPEEIVRSYLVNPFLYDADETFCCGCGDHVPYRECHWHETGENLQAYFDRLRSEASHEEEGAAVQDEPAPEVPRRSLADRIKSVLFILIIIVWLSRVVFRWF